MAYMIKWRILKRKGTDDYAKLPCWLQVAELTLYNNGSAVAWPSGTTAEASIPSKDVESASKLIDGSVSTKWAVDTGLRNTQYVDVSVTFTLPEKVAFDSYTYTTANDVVKRDPISWELYESSNNGATWTLLDERHDAAITDDRNTETPLFNIPKDAKDSDYNAVSRVIDAKILMYINGDNSAPIEINKGNYLVDLDILEEAYADGDGIFGSVTSNELSITLYNDDGIFSPTNENGPYYGKLKRGLKCQVFIRPADKIWALLGVFYVTDWKATITGVTASVIANDRLYSVFDAPSLALPVVKNETFVDFYTRVFNALSMEAIVDPTLTTPLVMSYNKSSNNALLTDMSTGAMSICYCNHSGIPVVKPLTAAQEVRAILTDNDQIINVEAEFSIVTGYDGASVVCNVPQESAVKSVLSVADFVVPNGVHTSAATELSSTPLVRLAYASLIGATSASITGIRATSNAVSITTDSSSADSTLPLEVYGTVVENVATRMGDDSSNMLSVDNIYVQDTEYADRLLRVLTKFVKDPLPVLKITVRGNPLLNIGDLLQAKSTRYNLDFTGILIRQHFTYNGALSGELTLLNAALLEV